MVYHPAMILEGSTLEIIRVAMTGLIGAGALAAGLEGYLLRQMTLIERGAALIGGLLFIMGDTTTDAIGLGLLVSLVTLQAILLRAERRAAMSIRSTDSKEPRSEEHTSEIQSLMRISYAVFCLKKTINQKTSNGITT